MSIKREPSLTALVSMEPAGNRFRFFVIELRASPEGGALLVRRWGRIGTAGRRTVERYETLEAAADARTSLLERRERRGYVEVGSGLLSQLLRKEAELTAEMERAAKIDVASAVALEGARRHLARLRSAMRGPRAPVGQLELPGLAA